MSQPKRLSLKSFAFGNDEMIENTEWVPASEYAALKAESERLKTELKASNNYIKANNLDPSSINAEGVLRQNISIMIDRRNEKIKELTDENERLRSKLNFSQSISETCKQLQEGEAITVKGAISSGKTILSCPCQCVRLTAENEHLKERVAFLERAERFQTYDHNTQTWVVRFSEPKSDVS